MRQWREMKARHPDALLFFQVGDFYELFREDAEEGARLLGLTLTTRNNGAAAGVPLAGVPAKALDDYLARVIGLGRRAAICEQVEDAVEGAKGIVRREVVETVTPGTVLEDTLLEAGRNNFLALLSPAPGPRLGLASVDLSTGEFVVEAVETDLLQGELGRLGAAEIVVPASLKEALAPRLAAPGSASAPPLVIREDWLFDEAAAGEDLLRHYRVHSLDGLGFEPEDGLLVSAAGALVAYISELQPRGAGHLDRPRIRRSGTGMLLDGMTRRNLELVEPLRAGDGGEAGTLIGVLDETVTAMGARMLRQWLLRPRLEAERIGRRLEAVAELASNRELRSGLRDRLGGIADIERLAAKVGSERAAPRELLALGSSLEVLPGLEALGRSAGSEALRGATVGRDLLEDVAGRIAGSLSEEAGATLQDGGVIRPGVSEELDELREVRDGARGFIASLQTRERERTGVGSLKVGFNRVFGYYLEVTRPNLDRVPDDYVRKQTLANAERYFTAELKEWEEKISGAEEAILELETRLFGELRSAVAAEVGRLQRAARRIARLDVLSTLAEVAVRRRYVRPEVHTGFGLSIRGGRHPVVETMMPAEAFIPNDIVLDRSGWMVVLTGPNMAGKSTVLRQVGLIQLLAQIGSFVPADEARIPISDRIFTRVGASDNLARGHSTFMVEMNEAAAILSGATDRSLVLLDEIGRGTSTYDGVSIAWAMTEHLHEKVGAKTIFATHYHELTQLGDLLEGVKNMTVTVREAGEEILFLRRLESGGADRSYGIQVARLAGLPPPIIERAFELLDELEGSHTGGGEGLGRSRPASAAGLEQLALFPAEHPVIERLGRLDPDELTPREALALLYSLTAEVAGRSGGSGSGGGG